MKKIALLLIIFLALVLRLYQVATIPVSLYWDEVSIGYNAYSILETGKDERGELMPLVFRAFDDYKLPGQIYLTVPSIKLFGLTEFAVRFPAVVVGTLTVLLSYFLVKKLFPKKENVALVTALFLAISPWHLIFTRASFEAGSGLMLVVLGATLFLNKKTIYLLLGVAFLALSTYFYRSAQVFSPLLLLGLVVFTRKFKLGILAMALFIILTAPILYQTFVGAGSVRISQVGVAAETFDETVESAKLIEQSGNSPLARIIYNRRLIYASQFVKNYLNHLNPSYLFLEGDPFARHRTVGVGALSYWEIVALPLGIIALRKRAKLLLYWWAVALIPAALSMPTPHSLRSLNVLPIPQLISAAGVIFFTRKLKFIGIIISSLVIGAFCYYSLQQYFIASPTKYSFSWGDPYKELVKVVNKRQAEGNYDTIVVTGANWQPYIYFAFYEQWDPKDFQLNGNNYEYKNYWFGIPDWDPLNSARKLNNIDLKTFTTKGEKVLFVLSPSEANNRGFDISKFQVLSSRSGMQVFLLSPD